MMGRRQVSSVLFAMVALALGASSVSCKKKDDGEAVDGGATSNSSLQEAISKQVFSFAHSFDSTANQTDTTHHLDGTEKSALIYFEPHATTKDLFYFLKVIQDARTGAHDVLGGRVLFSADNTAKFSTDHHCPGALFPAPAVTSLSDLLDGMKVCSNASTVADDAGVPADMGPQQPDAKLSDATILDAKLSDAKTPDSGPGDGSVGEGLKDAATGDAGASRAHTLKLDKTIKHRLYVTNSDSTMVLSQLIAKKPSGIDSSALKLLKVYQRVAAINDCNPRKPLDYLLLYANPKGKLLYSWIKQPSTGLFDVQEGEVTRSGQQLVLRSTYSATRCKSKIKLDPAKHPVYPANLWLSSTSCYGGSASGEIQSQYVTTDGKCSSRAVTYLRLTTTDPTDITRLYMAYNDLGGFPSNTGNRVHKFWSYYPY